MLKNATALLLFLMAASPAMADYVVLSSHEGNFCTGFGIEFCEFKRIDASVSGGTVYSLPDHYSDVDEYRDGRCWIHVHSGWGNWLAGDIPDFLRYVSGPRHLETSYESLGTPDDVTFKCKQRP